MSASRAAACARPCRPAIGANLVASHSSPPIASAAATMRGRRCRAAASIEKPNVAAPARSSDSALLQAPSVMAAAMPSGAEQMAEQEGARGREHKCPSAPRPAASWCSRARKTPATSALNSTCAGRPSASHISSARGRGRIGCGERAMLEQHLHDRLAEHEQPERRRQRQPDRKFERRATRHARSPCDPRRARRATVPAPAPCPWRRRPGRAAIRSGGWRNTAMTPRKATRRR